MPSRLRSVLIGAVVVFASVAGGGAAASADVESPIRPEEAEIVRLYRAIFDRAPDGGGYAFWVEKRTTGVPLEAVAEQFVASREFAMLFGAPTDTEFVDLLYANVLGRPPDPAGRAYWLGQLADGLSRIRVVLHFSESGEFVALTGTALPVLPPFRADVSTVTADQLGTSWRPGCPVGPEGLRRITMSHVGFDGSNHQGEIVVNAAAVDEVIQVFGRLYAARYPIERLEPVDRYGSDDRASMEANNTSAFNCRLVTGGTTWSRHAFGLAVDLNPVQNPYVTATEVLPPAGVGWVDRSNHHPAVVRAGDVVVSSFAAIGWRWGGDFRSIKDWHHFDR